MAFKKSPFQIFRRRRRNATFKSKGQKEDDSTKQPSGFIRRISTQLTLNQSFYDGSSSESHLTASRSGPSHSGTTNRIQSRSRRRKQQEVLELSTSHHKCAAMSFQAQMAQITPSKKETELVLHRFVETSSRHDIYALRDLLANESMRWQQVRLKDTTTATNNLRRWRFKKDNICHHIKDVCAARDIDLVWEDCVVMDVDDMPTIESVLGAISEIQKDDEITRLELAGRLIDSHTEQVLRALTSLLGANDRDWHAVQIQLGFGGSSPFEYQRWHQTMDTYGMLFNQINLQFGVPIDLEVLAAVARQRQAVTVSDSTIRATVL